MSPLTENITGILSFFVLASDVAIVLFCVILILAWKSHTESLVQKIVDFIGKYSLPFILVITATSVVTTLYYSEVAGLEPCKLCWFQRIFLYPQLVIVFVALIRKTRGIAYYLIPLSILGSIVSLYHYSLQWGGPPLIPCSADVALSCSKRFFLEFGYITESMMALTAFLLIITLSYARNLYEKSGDDLSAGK